MSRRFHGARSALVLVTILISAVGMSFTGIRVHLTQLLPKIGLYAVVLIGALFYHWRREPRFTAAFLVVFWMGVVSDFHVFPMFPEPTPGSKNAWLLLLPAASRWHSHRSVTNYLRMFTRAR